MQIRVGNSRSTPLRTVSFRQFTSFFLSFFFFFFFLLYRVCVRRLLLPFNIYEHFPGRRYKLLLYSLFTFNSTFYFPFRVPVSLLLFTLAGNELEGNQDARLFVRMEKRSYFERGSINIY